MGLIAFVHLISPLTVSDSIALPGVNQSTGDFIKSHVVTYLYFSNIHQSNRRPRVENVCRKG